MNIVKDRFVKDLGCEIIFGYITQSKRIALRLEKSHSNDAFVISGGQKQTRCCDCFVVQKRRNNRSLQLNRKGFKPSIRKQRYSCQPKDLVRIGKKLFEVIGTHTYGKSVVIKNGVRNTSVATKKVVWQYHFGGMVWKHRNAA
jgi:hypothetical protein